MAIEDIKKTLEQQFQEPLPEYHNRRIIFWNDEAKEFSDEIKDLTFENAKVVILTENNNFQVKKLLNHDDLTSNFLVYNPFITNMEDDWLFDVKLYSQEFRADQMSMWMQEMNIANIPAVFNNLKIYKGFLKAAKRREKLSKFSDQIVSSNTLHTAILASICNVDELDYKKIIKAVMADGDNNNNNLLLELLRYNASEIFWNLVKNTTGYNKPKAPNIDELNTHVVLNALSRTIKEEHLTGLEDKFKSGKSGFSYDLIIEWLNSQNKDDLVYVLRIIENQLNLVERFSKLDINDLIDTTILPCIDEIIINKLMEKFINRTANADEVISIVEKRRGTVWYEDNEAYYTGILQAANMQKFCEDHIDGYHHTSATDLWKQYTNEYYLMDKYYRHFHVAFSKSLNIAHTALDDNYRNLLDHVEGLYKVAFLDKLAENWTNLIKEDLKDTGRIPHIVQQTDFYQREVQSKDNKIFVIISDALRYEVAQELAEKLKRDTKADVKLGSQQSVFPSKTDFGMAALLPHRKLSLENLKVLADGQNTDASSRQDILQKENPKSVAVTYSDFIMMKISDQKELVKGQEVVYIYHDKIDKTGHNDEMDVFPACQDAIEEIFSLVKIITGRLNGINIAITSDHGFLYTYNPLHPSDKMGKSQFKDDILKLGRRYVIADKEIDAEGLIEVKGFYNRDNYTAYTPCENIRIKSSGAQKFVHGGLSLQEMVVPVINYKFVRSGYKSYEANREKYESKPVTLTLLTSSRKISNKIFKLSFYQKEAVKDNFVPCTYNIYLSDADGKPISDIQKIVADKTSTSSVDREYSCKFILKEQAYSNIDTYYLVIQDEQGQRDPIKEEMTIDIPMAIHDFDFFS